MLEVGQIVQFAEGSMAEARKYFSGEPSWQFQVTDVDVDTDDDHWPGCPSPLNCCCMPAKYQIVKLAGLNGRWYPSYLFTPVTPTA